MSKVNWSSSMDYRAFSCDVITFEITKENRKHRHFGVQRDRSFYGDLHEMSDILLMCVESDKIPLLHKLNSYINAYLWVF